MSDLHYKSGHLTRTTSVPYHLTTSCGCACTECSGGTGPCSLQVTLGVATIPACMQRYDCNPASPTYGSAQPFTLTLLSDPFTGYTFCSSITTCRASLTLSLPNSIKIDSACPISAYTSRIADASYVLRLERSGGNWLMSIFGGNGFWSGYFFLGYVAESDCFAPFTIPNMVTVGGCQTVDSTLQSWLGLSSSALMNNAIASIDAVTVTPYAGAGCM